MRRLLPDPGETTVDQQLDGYLKGDEPIRLENLHEGVPLVRTVLPGWRVRAVVQHLVDRGRKVAVQELPLALDTLYVDTDARTLVLLWLEQRWAEDVNLAFFQINVWVGAAVLAIVLAARMAAGGF